MESIYKTRFLNFFKTVTNFPFIKLKSLNEYLLETHLLKIKN